MGADDALALAYALRCQRLHVLAVTLVSGNVPVAQAFANAHLVIQAAGVSTGPTVSVGASRPLKREPIHAEQVHGPDGMGGITSLAGPTGAPRYPQPQMQPPSEDAPDAIRRLLLDSPGQITVVTTGPLTNLALLHRRDPSALLAAREVICMAGAFRVPGNVTPAAEYNVYADPHAARELLHSGAPITFVGLDVTMRVALMREQLAAWCAEHPSPLGQLLVDCTAFCMEFHQRVEGYNGMAMHDPLAVAFAADRTLLQLEPMRVDVETEGLLTAGMTLADLRSRNVPKQGVPVSVAVEVDAARFMADFRGALFGQLNSPSA